MKRLDFAAGSCFPIDKKVWEVMEYANDNYSTNINSNGLLSKPTLEMTIELRKEILDNLNLKDPSEYSVIFFSCASEANTFVIMNFLDGKILLSSYEHDSIRSAYALVPNWETQIFAFDPHFDLDIVKNGRPDLLCMMHVNNETGEIFDVEKISKSINPKFTLTDCVQSFGKHIPANLTSDFVTFAFHKIAGGVTGIGGLAYKTKHTTILKSFTSAGKSNINGNLRGGTPSVILLWGAKESLNLVKNKKLMATNVEQMLNTFLINLNKIYPVITLQEYNKHPLDDPIYFVVLSPINKNHYRGILLISLITNKFDMCNLELKKFFEDNGVILTISSACNSSSSASSHVLSSLGANELVKRGVHRLSFYGGDSNVLDNIPALYVKFCTKKINSSM